MTTDETRDQSGNMTTEALVAKAMRESWSDEVEYTDAPEAITAALRAAGLLVEGAPTDERPYAENIDHEYGAWETDDLEEHAQDMLAVVRHRRDAAGVAPPAPSADREKLIADARELVNSWDSRGSWTPDSPIGMVSALADALATPTPVRIADEVVQKLRGLGLDDTAIRERLAQATVLAAVPVSDELVQVVVKIAAKATLTSGDLHQMEHRGIRVALPRGPAPVDEAKLAEVIDGVLVGCSARLYVSGEQIACAVREYLDSLR